MKFIIFSLLFISAVYYCSAQTTTLATLLARATALEANATAEIAVLRAANRTAAATELAREERLINELVGELNSTTANLTAAQITRLEERLRDREIVLREELTRLANATTTASRFRRQAANTTLETLLARAAALEANATAEIAVLRAANRTAVATELAREERLINELVRELNSTTANLTAAQITRLEERLRDREIVLREELRRLANATSTGARFRRQTATLETLLARARALEANATAEIAVLRAANRTAAATELAREERLINELVAELSTTTTNYTAAQLTRIESQLRDREIVLREELTRLANTTTTASRFRRQAANTTLETLLARAAALEANATAEIAVLRAANRTAAATELAREERLINELVRELNSTTANLTEAQITRLEERLRDREIVLREELRRLANATTTASRFRRQAANTTLETLLARAATLEANATAEIAVLRAANRTGAATELAREERLINELVRELNSTTANLTEAQITRLEERLRDREIVLRAELRRLANATANATTTASRFRRQAANTTLETLLARATALEANATAEVATLRAANRTAAANELQREVRLIEELVSELQNATNATEAQIRRLEERLRDREIVLAAELRLLTATNTTTGNQEAAIQALLTRATTLEANATAEIAVLRAANRTAAANELAREERAIQLLVTELTALEATAPAAELRRLEVELAAREAALAAELRLLRNAA